MSNQESLKLYNQAAEAPIIEIESVKKNIDNLEKKYSNRFAISLKDVQNNPEIKEKKNKLDQDIKKYQDDKAILDKEQKKYQDLQSEIIKLEISKKAKETIYSQKKTENSPESQKIANSTNLEIEKLWNDINTKNEELKKIDIKWLEKTTEDDIANIYKSLSAYQDILLAKYEEKITTVDWQLKDIYTSELQPQYNQTVSNISAETDKIKSFEDGTDNITSTNLKNENIKKEGKKIDKNYESIKESQRKKMDLYTQWIAIKFYKYRIESAKVNLYKDLYSDLSRQFANIDKDILWVQKKYYEWQKNYFWNRELEFKSATLYKLAWESKNKKEEYSNKSIQSDKNPEIVKINETISNTWNISNYMNTLTKYIDMTVSQNIYTSLSEYHISEKESQNNISRNNSEKIQTAKSNYDDVLTKYTVYADDAKEAASKWNYNEAEKLQKKYDEEKNKLNTYNSEWSYYANRQIDVLANIVQISGKITELSKPLQNFQTWTKGNLEKAKSDYTKIKDPSKIKSQSPENSEKIFETEAQKDIKETLPKTKEKK